ncbi:MULTISPECIES: hypothetical protein [unclassified Thermoactinomyces]|uniref:hypothetical protein n=1 Tax=unclassified Thermoactinomyces TaxID=2634588 RepID=UPI0018DE8CB6|nr:MULTISPECIES: hypothetical protein [unclassified Thermoactinomyces]MBH8598671.1 hypothetical protein [Thermoactinomyces sp. CICC 10523]MBH8605070.1 hypothetical protein [Thermoactinomyces sp. CICC 10522]MBH8606327.1 hypothetical protein [Thermoactinomyces sp. CICC 10521]
MLAINPSDPSLEGDEERYDCMECGAQESIVIIDNRGFCSTPGCLHNDPVQFVFFPQWPKPKACHIERKRFLK